MSALALNVQHAVLMSEAEASQNFLRPRILDGGLTKPGGPTSQVLRLRVSARGSVTVGAGAIIEGAAEGLWLLDVVNAPPRVASKTQKLLVLFTCPCLPLKIVDAKCDAPILEANVYGHDVPAFGACTTH